MNILAAYAEKSACLPYYLEIHAVGLHRISSLVKLEKWAERNTGL